MLPTLIFWLMRSLQLVEDTVCLRESYTTLSLLRFYVICTLHYKFQISKFNFIKHALESPFIKLLSYQSLGLFENSIDKINQTFIAS